MVEKSNSQFVWQQEYKFQRLSSKCHYRIEIQHENGLNITEFVQFNIRRLLTWKSIRHLIKY